MQKRNKLIAMVLALTLAVSSIMTVNADEATSTLVGTFQATVIDVTISSNVNYTYNPNGTSPETVLVADNIQVNSNTTCPVTIKIKGISVAPESTWQPTLVAPNAFTDWKALTLTETDNNVAVGISTSDDEDWMAGFAEQTLYSVDITDIELGSLLPDGSIEIKPVIKAGTAIASNKTLITNALFEITIAE